MRGERSVFSFWKEALKVTGSIAVIGFLFGLIIRLVFREDVISVFGSEKLFYLTLILITILFASLIIAIRYKYKKPTTQTSMNNRADINDSNVKGDIVVGNKNTYGSDTRD